jgi:hypothetical protein
MSTDARPNFAMFALAAVNVLALIGILASPLLFYVSLFLFDNPTAGSEPVILGMALVLWSYPVTAGIGGVMALRAYKVRDGKRLLWWTLCSISSVIAIAGSILILMTFCNGQFNCSRS